MASQPPLRGYSFHDLYNPEKLSQLSGEFYDEVRAKAPELWKQFAAYRDRQGAGLSEPEVSSILIGMSGHLSAFLAGMFGVADETDVAKARAVREQVVFRFRREFIVRRTLKRVSREEALKGDLTLLDGQVASLRRGFLTLTGADDELAAATVAVTLLDHERYLKVALPEESRQHLQAISERLRGDKLLRDILPAGRTDESLKGFLSGALSILERWAAGHFYGNHGVTAGWVSFKVPRETNYNHLVDLHRLNIPVPGTNVGPEDRYRNRDGFDLTDQRYVPREVMGEVDYCIFCHERTKDSCSRGFPAGKDFKKNPLGYTLAGCPLDQRISESQMMKGRGDDLGALALIMIDNPMVPGTGHRICNDCMKSCIYQKQDPVDIPQIETGILTDVLDLPWGFEIYSLLTRWNPLNIQRPHALPYNGMNILIVGLGPAGYTLAHYFLNEGFGVVAVDGLKIEPLPERLSGGGKKPFAPVEDYASLCTSLSERVLLGFGGVSEYGITVRWDKNFLTVIYLNLLRRGHFRVYDGVRFGGTLTVEDAWKYGFDHICFASGAGKPTFVSMKNNLIRGIRKASDFLMALQLTGAGKKDSLANLQVQLPAVVVGGGLTAIDAATELMAYYPVQVTKIKKRYERLVAQYGTASIDRMFDPEERSLLKTYLSHADAIEKERKLSQSRGETANFIPLIRSWGGVHIFYRKSMNDAPAYRLNHEEIIKSLEEGISFVENMSPVEAVPDEYGAVKELIFEQMQLADGKWKPSGKTFRVPARSVLIAAGTSPNVIYEHEHPGTFELDQWNQFFQSYRHDPASESKLLPASKGDIGFFTSYEANGRYVSYYGDNHPEFEGNVVRAMASAKLGHRHVLAVLEKELGERRSGGSASPGWEDFVQKLDGDLKARVVVVNRLTPTITEIVVRAPKAAREFRPGQFYRLQSYEVDAPRVEDTLLLMEGIALTGAWVDRDKGEIGLITLEVGASSKLCALLKPGQRVVVMGPTGYPTEITRDGTVLLLGGGLGNAVLFSIADAFKQANNRVVYFAGYKRKEDLFKREEIEASTDVVVYSVDAGDTIKPRRPQDRTFVGNIVEAMLAYCCGTLGEVPVSLRDADRIIAIGSDRMMAAVTKARHDVLKPYLREDHTGIASINSPMQCMMKAICAQCLQRHVDPDTGKEEFVFSCVNQDQKMDEIDFGNLSGRLKANSLMEKISNRWLEYIVEKHRLERV